MLTGALTYEVRPAGIFSVDITGLSTCSVKGCTAFSVSADFDTFILTIAGTVWSGETKIGATAAIYDPTTPATYLNPQKLFQKIFVDELGKRQVTWTNQDNTGTVGATIATLNSKPFSGKNPKNLPEKAVNQVMFFAHFFFQNF